MKEIYATFILIRKDLVGIQIELIVFLYRSMNQMSELHFENV